MNRTKTYTPPLPFDGYVFVLEKDDTFEWGTVADDHWEMAMASKYNESTYAVHELGSRVIDGARHAVFLCRDGRVRAITMHAARATAQREGHA